MTETTTAPEAESDLLPCSICRKQPELVIQPTYFYRCQCVSVPFFGLTPEEASASWNHTNDMSNFEPTAEDIEYFRQYKIHSSVKEKGSFPSFKKYISIFFRKLRLLIS